MSPENFVKSFVDHGVPSASFTYTEPTVWQDWMQDCCTGIHQDGGLCGMVTNGFFSEATLARLQGQIDAFNIDLKGNDAFYQRYCGGRLGPVKTAISAIAAMGSGGTPDAPVLEITTMIIEGIHTPADIEDLGRFLADSGVQAWHLSRFFPRWRMNCLPPCSETWLEQMLAIARDTGIPHIYGGNSRNCGNTLCPACRTVVLPRSPGGELTPGESGTGGVCPSCGRKLYGRFR